MGATKRCFQALSEDLGTLPAGPRQRSWRPGDGCFTMFDDTARGLAVAWVLF